MITSLRTEQTESKTSLYLDDLLIAVYSPILTEPAGDQKRIDMKEYDFQGCLLLSTSFFHRFQLQKPPDSKSQMKNIAKAFFKYDEKNHACLVQYLHPNGCSSEHYHSLDEYIVCLAGDLKVCMRDFDGYENIAEMNPGSILTIAPKTWHKVVTYDTGSITVPIKQTIEGRKDHFYE